MKDIESENVAASVLLGRALRTSPAVCAGRAWGGRRRTSRRWPGRWWAMMVRRRAWRSCSSTGPSSDAAAPVLRLHLPEQRVGRSPHHHHQMVTVSYYLVACIAPMCCCIMCAVMTRDLKCLLFLLCLEFLYLLDQDKCCCSLCEVEDLVLNHL